MILVDLTQIVVSNIMVNLKYDPKAPIDENLIRHMVLDSIRYYNSQYKSEYGRMVICCDSKSYWRRDVFPFYKHSRKKDRDASAFDWNLIFDTLTKLKVELKETFPYKVLEVDGAEADDIIAVLTKWYHKTEKIMILSSDKDFVQLQKYPNVYQFSPLMKRHVKVDNPIAYVREHVIKGDRGDGIPNILSADNVFVIGERQKSVTQAKLSEWIQTFPAAFEATPEMKTRFQRNETLINFDSIPLDIESAILNLYDDALKTNNPRQKIFNYFIHHQLKQLMEHIDDF